MQFTIMMQHTIFHNSQAAVLHDGRARDGCDALRHFLLVN